MYFHSCSPGFYFMRLQVFILLLKRFLPHEQSPFQSDLSEIVSTAWYVSFSPVLNWRHLPRQLSVIKEKWMPCRVLPFWTWNLSIMWVYFLKADILIYVNYADMPICTYTHIGIICDYMLPKNILRFSFVITFYSSSVEWGQDLAGMRTLVRYTCY